MSWADARDRGCCGIFAGLGRLQERRNGVCCMRRPGGAYQEGRGMADRSHVFNKMPSRQGFVGSPAPLLSALRVVRVPLRRGAMLTVIHGSWIMSNFSRPSQRRSSIRHGGHEPPLRDASSRHRRDILGARDRGEGCLPRVSARTSSFAFSGGGWGGRTVRTSREWIMTCCPCYS